MQEHKIAMVGDTGVGKTCIATRFVTDKYNDQSMSTNSASYLRKTITVGDQQVKFQIWDTAGQESYRSLAPMYYRSASAVLVVFDITRPKTFDEVKYWVNQIQQNASQGVIIVLVGNKIDRVNERAVSKEAAESYAKQISASYVETSAASGMGITEIFQDLGRRKMEVKKEVKLQIVEDDVKPGCC